MWYKAIDNELVPPPVNFATPDGQTICNFDLAPSLMTQYGWRDWSAEEVEAWRAAHPEPEPPLPTVFTKLQIRRAMRGLGIEDKLDALLAGSAMFRSDWQDAQEIDLADPVLVEALAAGSITDADIAAIRAAIAGA